MVKISKAQTPVGSILESSSVKSEYKPWWWWPSLWWWVIPYLGHLKVHFMLIKYTSDSKSQTLRMRYLFQSTGRPISHQNGWSFRVYMIPLRDFVPEWNSRCGATTGLNSRRGDSRRHDILWWFHENKCWAMRGYRTELAAARKSPRCRVNTPWELLELRNGLFPWPMFSSTLALDQSTRKKSLCYCKIRFQKNQSFLQPPFLSSFSVGKRPKRL